MDLQKLPAEIAGIVNTAQLPQLYETAKNALTECEKLDECAEWADKAAAIASYARQADNLELEYYARRIRARAVRRCGELLRSFDARGQGKSEQHKRRTAVNIAEIPTDEFEAAIESERPPGTTLLAQLNKLNQPERMRSVTERSLAEVFKSAHAARAVEGMLGFEKNADACGVEVIVEILRGHTKKLERVRRGIGLAFRLNAALEESGLRGDSMLRQVPDRKPDTVSE